MELKQAIHDRRAVREYTAEPVSQAQLEALIGLAIQAPSAMNRQPWSFCVVRDQELLQRISDQAKAHLLKEGLPGSAADRFEQMLSNPDFHIFYHAPALILISATEEDPWGRVDCALAAENLMLGAAGMGLGSCWIGFAEGWLQTAEGKETLEIPASHMPVAPIIVGHPRHAILPTGRNQPEIRWIG
jgi:nitroreductase